MFTLGEHTNLFPLHGLGLSGTLDGSLWVLLTPLSVSPSVGAQEESIPAVEIQWGGARVLTRQELWASEKQRVCVLSLTAQQSRKRGASPSQPRAHS